MATVKIRLGYHIVFANIDELPREVQDELFLRVRASINENGRMYRDMFATSCNYVFDSVLVDEPNDNEALPVCVIDGKQKYMDFAALGKSLFHNAVEHSGQADQLQSNGERTRVSGETLISGLSYLVCCYMLGVRELDRYNHDVDSLNAALSVARANGGSAESPIVYMERMNEFAEELESL